MFRWFWRVFLGGFGVFLVSFCFVAFGLCRFTERDVFGAFLYSVGGFAFSRVIVSKNGLAKGLLKNYSLLFQAS